MDLETAKDIYLSGAIYTYCASMISFFVFTLYRYKLAIQHYIKTGEIQNGEYSWFFTDRWVFAPTEINKYERERYYLNHPVVATIDCLVFAVFVFLGVSLAWPISLTVGLVIAYARWARIQYKKKEEFIGKLDGTYQGNR